MDSSPYDELTLEMKHTGERIALRRIKTKDGREEIRIKGSLPAHREGPPLHVHFAEDEYGEVIGGTLSALVGGKRALVEAGGSMHFPKGIAHRWWNDGDEELAIQAVVSPAIDLDRYLQTVFEVVNAGPAGRPPLFYMAHVLYRHRNTQMAFVVPRLLQRVVFPVVILLGTILGKYRGTAWPGCPARCTGAPLVSADDAEESDSS